MSWFLTGWRATYVLLCAFVFVCREKSMRRYLTTLLSRIAVLTAMLATGFVSVPASAAVEDVLKAAGQDGQAQVLVRMKADGGGAAPWSARLSPSRQRVAVATALNDAAPAFLRAKIAGLRQFRTIPYVAATVTREQAMALAADDAVEGIYLIRRERRMELTKAERERGALLTSAQVSIGVGTAWERGFDGAGTAIAVIDGGINVAHPALAGKNIGDACFANTFGTTTIAQCPSGQTPQISAGAASYCPADSTRCDHGTHVASIAVGNDGANFGIARGAKLVPIDVFSLVTDPAECSPDPAPCVLTDSLAVLNALDYVNEHAVGLGIVAVNLSIGGASRDGYCDDDPRKSVIDMLRQKGVAVAVAASNGGLTGKITTPACISSAVAVGSIDGGTTVSSFSNFAATLDFVAPGLSVPGAKGSGSGYGTRSGTSMAAPQVAGAFAILRQAFPTLSIDTLEGALKQTGTPVTRLDSGITVASLQIGPALDKLQGLNRRLFNNVFAAGNSALGESLLRFYNPGAEPGNVKVTLRDSDSGAYLGDWISPPIPGHGALQFSAKSIQANATRDGAPLTHELRAYFNFEITSSFNGSAQHVVWNEQGGVLSNLSSCSSPSAAGGAKVLMNVHSSAFNGYPSRIRIVNTGAVPASAKLALYNAGTGVKVAEWATPEIGSAAAYEIMVPVIESRVLMVEGAMLGSNGYYNVAIENFSGYLQHLVENMTPGALIDMTAKCDIAVSSAVP